VRPGAQLRLEGNILGIVDDVAVAAIVIASGDTEVGAPLGSEHAGVRHLCNSEGKKYKSESEKDLKAKKYRDRGGRS
jgi:hypothetical protein